MSTAPEKLSTIIVTVYLLAVVLFLFGMAMYIDFVVAMHRLPMGSGELLNWAFGWGRA